MNNPFLTSAASLRSLNRAVIAYLPELPALEGKRAYSLLSVTTLHQQLSDHASTLKIDPHGPDVLLQLDRCFADVATRDLAIRIATDYGIALAGLLIMLHRGDVLNRQARPQWQPEHWAFWAHVRRVAVGGGIVAGQLGIHALAAAQQFLDDHAIPITVERSRWSNQLALVGLATSYPQTSDAVLVFDFGQTAVKRAIAHIAPDRTIHLQDLASITSRCDLKNPTPTIITAQMQWNWMLDVIRTTHDIAPLPDCAISVACYLYNGQPDPNDMGCYGQLQLLTTHLQNFMQAQLHHDGIRHVHLLHDGAAAASAYTSDDYDIVLTLGTAIGNGFPPSAISR